MALDSREIPNFPTPPAPTPAALSMPNDLVANKRNYYTEVMFMDYRSAVYGQGSGIANFLNTGIPAALNATSAIGSTGLGSLIPFGSGIANALLSLTSGGEASTDAVRLPIPLKINDMQTLNWEPKSGTQLIGSVLPAPVSQALQAGGALIGKTINPLLYLAFNSQYHREFTFEWILAPRTRKESETVKKIVKIFKNSSLPTKDIVMDYPLIARVRMFPNNLDGLANFKPMAVQAINANYTANPNPSFFENTGAPTIVTLTVKFIEIKLWYRGAGGEPI